ncbi:MAG: magnesium transporter [Firmicutes bacterium]|nr:magnesium transporter [Bacillota bacterium]
MDFERIKALLADKNFSLLQEELINMQAADVAEFLEDLEVKIALLVFRLLHKEMATDVFSYLSHDRQSELLMLVNEKEFTEIIDDLYFDDKIDLLEEMPAYVVKKILRNASETERRLINQFLNYPDNSAGSLMTIEFVDLKKEMLVKDALDRIRKIALDKETIYTCYAINAHRVLEGIVSLKDLVLAPLDKKVADVMQKEVIFVNTYDDQEYIADIVKKYDLLSVPVVDNEQRLVGIITIDDIVDVIEEENTEDFHRMAALEPMEEEYLSASIFGLARKRIVWMMVLMLSATLTSFIIQKYNVALSAVISLAAYIPMLTGTGGNAGAQASTLSIRSIALGEVGFKDIFKVIWTEMRVSFLVGITLAIINFLRILFLEPALQDNTFSIAITVSATMLITVMIAKMIGGTLPILAKQLKLDPAIMATPVISTIVDALTLLVYFTFATWIFGIAS